MGGWWERDIMDAGKLPLMLTLLSFIGTFLVTRIITRLIRAGRGPFRNTVLASGLHIHHAVPGIVLLVTGAFVAIGAHSRLMLYVAAVLVGVGVSLVLDEFALILHLRDVYWTEEGQTSVAVVSLAAASLAFALIGNSPIGISGIGSGELRARLTATATLVVNAAFLVVCLRKGKYATTVLGLFIPFVSLVGAVRLADPSSAWARRHYGPEKLERARARHERFDQRFGRPARAFSDFVAGRPTPPASRTPRIRSRGALRAALRRRSGRAAAPTGQPGTGRTGLRRRRLAAADSPRRSRRTPR